jgi:hypothetical protein
MNYVLKLPLSIYSVLPSIDPRFFSFGLEAQLARKVGSLFADKVFISFPPVQEVE